jgi:polysaccharide deacetylase
MRNRSEVVRFSINLVAIATLAVSGCGSPSVPHPAQLAAALTRSSAALGGDGAAVTSVPQFVAVTFDDNFNAEAMDWATAFFRPLVNPPGAHDPGTFDGTPVRTTFPSNSTYLGGLQASWQRALDDGHEISNHTVDHSDGIAFSVEQWRAQIANCTSQMAAGLTSRGALPASVGFRAPYLHYDDNLFTALTSGGFVYDSSIMGGWADSDGPGSAPWPYTMDFGSRDADAIYAKWSGRNVVPVSAHPGLWELPVVTLFVPDDSLAAQYHFAAGLRQRLQNRLAGAPNPNFFEPSTGKLVGMDITLILDGGMSRAEALATLEYTLDQRLAGNRAPMVFVAHTHVYAANWDGNAAGVPNTLERRSIIEDFVTYALSKPEVRMRPLGDLAQWMAGPQTLGPPTCTPASCAAAGKRCGTIADGCGGTLGCGDCPSGQRCTASNLCEPAVASGCPSTVAGYALGRCDATAVYNGTLYRCRSQALGVNGETAGCGSPGVYCSAITPDAAAWGPIAWQLVQSCDGSAR